MTVRACSVRVLKVKSCQDPAVLWGPAEAGVQKACCV